MYLYSLDTPTIHEPLGTAQATLPFICTYKTLPSIHVLRIHSIIPAFQCQSAQLNSSDSLLPHNRMVSGIWHVDMVMHVIMYMICTTTLFQWTAPPPSILTSFLYPVWFNTVSSRDLSIPHVVARHICTCIYL